MNFQNHLIFGAVVVLALLGQAHAATEARCSATLSTTPQPVLTGLTSKRISEAGRSTEGGSAELFLDKGNRPAYLMVENYGETGKRKAIYTLSDTSSSFSALVTESTYAEPIYAGVSQVVQVRVTNFVVCDGEVTEGVGDSLIPNEIVQSSRDDVNRAFQLLMRDR
jgi:hypothetical protein